jgi:hypothetical protein
MVAAVVKASPVLRLIDGNTQECAELLLDEFEMEHPVSKNVSNPLFQPNKICDIYSIAGCAASVGAAALICGPLGPADVACILTALATIPGCGPCLCSAAGCPQWCRPCAQDQIYPATGKQIEVGSCAEAGYDICAGKRKINDVTFHMYKKNPIVMACNCCCLGDLHLCLPPPNCPLPFSPCTKCG